MPLPLWWNGMPVFVHTVIGAAGRALIATQASDSILFQRPFTLFNTDHALPCFNNTVSEIWGRKMAWILLALALEGQDDQLE